jgi:hypothetical protein
MLPIRLDHFITYTSAASIDEYLQEYQRAGFRMLERTTRHDPGLRNGFLGFLPEYVEYCWVEDEAKFAASDESEKPLRDAVRPYGIGIVTTDIRAVHDEWAARGYDPPAVWSKTPADTPIGADPVWSFQDIPAALEPGGVLCFVLQYHLPRPIAQLHIASNSTYAIAGIVCVTNDPDARAKSWRRLLAPEEPIAAEGSTRTLTIGPHVATWLTPAEYERRYGWHWTAAPHAYGEMGALHVLAEDLAVAQAALSAAGRSVREVVASSGRPASLFVAPDPHDGFAFVITEQPAHDWLAWRTALTGEQLSI